MKIYFKGDTVPPSVLSFHKRVDESVLPSRVEFTRSVLVTNSKGIYHIRPIFGFFQVNCIYADEASGCIIKGGGSGIFVHVVPIINILSICVFLLITLLALNYGI